MEALVIFGHLSDGLVHPPPKYSVWDYRPGRVKRVWRFHQAPHVLQKAHGPGYRRIGPFGILIGRPDKQLVNARGVSAVSLHQIVRRNAVPFGLRHDHPAPVSYTHLTLQTNREVYIAL